MNETARDLAIDVQLIDGRVIDTNIAFEFRKNPQFFDIRPRDHLAV